MHSVGTRVDWSRYTFLHDPFTAHRLLARVRDDHAVDAVLDGSVPSAFALVRDWRIAFLLPSLLAALATLWLLQDLGRRLWTARVGLYAALALLAAVCAFCFMDNLRAAYSTPREQLAVVRRMALDLSMPILVVDDYQTMVRIIRNLLKQLGFEDVDDASDGTTALAKLKQKQYGLVISDWNMEPMTGLDLLKEVRADASLKSMPFIMVTAESKTENVVAAKQAGVSNYIVKPFNAETLRDKIEKVLVHA